VKGWKKMNVVQVPCFSTSYFLKLGRKVRKSRRNYFTSRTWLVLRQTVDVVLNNKPRTPLCFGYLRTIGLKQIAGRRLAAQIICPALSATKDS
jgi:hypothetical protein